MIGVFLSDISCRSFRNRRESGTMSVPSYEIAHIHVDEVDGPLITGEDVDQVFHLDR